MGGIHHRGVPQQNLVQCGTNGFISLATGRPWQYERDVVHHGKKNMYSFKKDGVTYKLQPLVEEEFDKVVEFNVLLMSGKEFLIEIKQYKEIGFSIIVKPKEELSSQ